MISKIFGVKNFSFWKKFGAWDVNSLRNTGMVPPIWIIFNSKTSPLQMYGTLFVGDNVMQSKILPNHTGYVVDGGCHCLIHYYYMHSLPTMNVFMQLLSKLFGKCVDVDSMHAQLHKPHGSTHTLSHVTLRPHLCCVSTFEIFILIIIMRRCGGGGGGW